MDNFDLMLLKEWRQKMVESKIVADYASCALTTMYKKQRGTWDITEPNPDELERYIFNYLIQCDDDNVRQRAINLYTTYNYYIGQLGAVNQLPGYIDFKLTSA